ELERLAERSATNLVHAIAASKTRGLARLLYALGIRYVGERAARLLAEHFGRIDRLQAASATEIGEIHGIGPRIAESVRLFFEQTANRRAVERLAAVGVDGTEAGGRPHGPALLEALRSTTAAERRAAAAQLGEVGDARAVDGLAHALHDPDTGVRQAASDALWAVWSRSGDPAVDALFQQGVELMSARRFAEAVDVFSEVIRRAPSFAEGWNKRATVYYLMGVLDRSLADCEEVIRLNPIHFGALSWFGL